jgi:hypothetical protein
LIEPTFARPNSSIDSYLALGDKGAEQLLRRYIREWEQRNQPGESDLSITVSYEANGTPHVRHRWLSPRT